MNERRRLVSSELKTTVLAPVSEILWFEFYQKISEHLNAGSLRIEFFFDKDSSKIFNSSNAINLFFRLLYHGFKSVLFFQGRISQNYVGSDSFICSLYFLKRKD